MERGYWYIYIYIYIIAKMKVLGELREENDILKDGLQESKQEIQELITRYVHNIFCELLL